MRSRSFTAAASDLESLRLQWAGFRADLVFCFCPPDLDLGRHVARRVSAAFPNATVIGCSTAGEIGVGGAGDGLVSLLGLDFDSTVVRTQRVALDSQARSGPAGQEVEALFGAVHVGLRGYASVILIGVIASLVTGIVSRITVRRFLA